MREGGVRGGGMRGGGRLARARRCGLWPAGSSWVPFLHFGSNPSLLSTGAIVWTMEALGRVIAGLLSEPETQHLAHFEVRDGWGDVLVCACVDTPEPTDNKAHAHLAAFQKRKPRGEGGGGDISGKC